MSRIYDNKPVSSLPVDNIDWKVKWSSDSFQKGVGVLIECTLKSRSRHAITDSTGTKARYVALHVSVRRAHRRKFGASGVEVEPNFSETEKIRTGYLNSSYKTVAKGDDDTLTQSDLIKIVQPAELLQLTKNRNQPGCITLWIAETDLQGIELEIDNIIRIRTKGDGPFIETVTRLDAAATADTVCNYSGGEQVGASWTDKIMAVKADKVDSSTPTSSRQPGEGASDDEWND